MKKKVMLSLIMAAALGILAACGAEAPKAQEAELKTEDVQETTQAETDAQASGEDAPDMDRAGNPITVPDTVERVMTAGPSNSEILVGLGYADKIVAADAYSAGVEGINSDIPMFDMAAPDVEAILAIKPDVIFATGMVQAAGDDVYKPFAEAGICVIYIPSSNSIESIKDDIRFMAEVMGDASKGDQIIADMDTEITAIKEIGSTITEKKKVYFEIAAAPNMYSFGDGVFLNEMIEIIGAENILQDQKEWLNAADESILGADPDVILTSVNYIDNPVDEIKARPGWDAVTAVKEDAVYYIDTNASNNPSQNIVKALKEMAKAVYPDKY